MPRSPRPPPRPPLELPTLEAALAGDELAWEQVVLVVGQVVREVLAKWSRQGGRSRDPSLGVWLHLLEDDFLVLREWQPAAGTFEQHVAEAVRGWLDDATAKDARATAWTPALVSIALDREPPLQEQLARDVLEILRRRAHETLYVHGSSGGGATPEDMSQSFAEKLFADRGATLRAWQPARGCTTLSSYLRLIGRRYFQQVMRKGGKVVAIHEDAVALPAPSSDPAMQLHRAMMWEAATAALDEDERALLELVRQGVTAEEGAVALGINANTFNQRKHRLLKKLKGIMKALDGGEG
jgi:DNA-directed RNA polymerase specialized sigma24 family protein